MSKDKYPSIFSPQMEAIVFIILQIFFATHEVFKIGEYLTIIHQSGGKYPLLSPTLRSIIVLVYTTQAEKQAALRVTLFVTIYRQKPFCFSSAARR